MSDREQLIASIEKEFEGVALKNGIGVYEADAVDNNASQERLEKERVKDIRDDWRKLSDDLIDQYDSVLSFMDEDGLRFAIPAYMRFAVKNFDTCASSSVEAIIYVLGKRKNWGFLSISQKQVVANFLSFMVMEAGDCIDTSQASLVYENIWSEYDR